MLPDLGFCPLAAEAAMSLLSFSASPSQPRPSLGTTEEGEKRHRPRTSSTRPRTGSICGEELRSRPESSEAACESREIEEEASRREAAAAGRGGRQPLSGAPQGGESETLGLLSQARAAGHGGSLRDLWRARRARSRRRRPPARAGMGWRGLVEARGGAAATAGIDRGEASAEVTHDEKAASDEDGSEDSQYVLCVIESLKTKVTEDRFTYIKKRIEENRTKLSTVTPKTSNASKVWQRNTSKGTDLVSNLLTRREADALCSGRSLGVSPSEEDVVSYEEQSSNATSTVMLGGNLATKNAIMPIKLPEVLKHPCYTTWTFLHRNQRMAEDQSVVCSDNEFNGSEDYIVRMTIQKFGMTDAVLESLAQSFYRDAGDIKARYEILHGKKTTGSSKEMFKRNAKVEDVYRDKDLDAALDSFDTLFCRRCLVFDCRLHGCSQDLVFPTEKQSPWNSMDEDGIPCGIHCYKLASKVDATTTIDPDVTIDRSTGSSRKNDAPQTGKNAALAEDCNDSTEGTDNDHSATYVHDNSRKEESVELNICRQEYNGRSWKVIEQGLLVKGLEIFGRNSCLIARNLLGGMKTCSDIFQYMNYTDFLSGVNSLSNGHIEPMLTSQGHELRVRSRFFRRRGKARRLRHTSKSSGNHFIRKRIAEKNAQLYQQYNPCGCQSACGKECPCLKNGTCCEKYCGCPKMCRNRFPGCQCARTQCRSRQCPCFASDRECDPDVCRNCWVECGDGSLGFPKQRGDDHDCRNMKVLLKEQQRILLGRSDVCGWGAFVKNAVGKDEYLGEYTGELISHEEAGRRGTIYDQENSTFLFNLNNEFVLDALRMGNKLKFANHSPDPNCYAKVMLVAGDHRVGIFAKERIGAGEEIFYDYHFAPDETPAWALKPDAAPGAKDPGQASCTRRGKKPDDAPGAKDPGQPSCLRGKKPGH